MSLFKFFNKKGALLEATSLKEKQEYAEITAHNKKIPIKVSIEALTELTLAADNCTRVEDYPDQSEMEKAFRVSESNGGGNWTALVQRCYPSPKIEL